MIAGIQTLNLYEAARKRRREAHRPGTRRNLAACQKLYLQFCLVYEVNILQPSTDDLAAFAEWLITANLAPSTIKNYLSAIKGLYLLWNIKPIIDIFESYAWSLTLRAIPFANRSPATVRPSMTFDHLLALVRVCSHPSTWPLRVALSFGFLGYLRVSNLAPQTPSTFDQTRHTTWGDVVPTKDGIMLSLKWTKSRQTSDEAAPIPLPVILESEICPLSNWTEYVRRLAHLSPTHSTPLLLTTHPPVGRVITISALRALLRGAAEAAGLSHFHYTPHSLRRGGAAFSFSAGVPLEHIKYHGTWQSSAVDRYLQGTPRFHTPVAAAFASALAGHE